MKPISSQQILIIGFFLVLTGAVLPLLMVVHILESTFFLNFIAFASQVAGLFLGTIGMIYYVHQKKH